MHPPQILCLSKSGRPIKWIDVETAIVYHAKEMVLWSLGEFNISLHGGINRASGLRSSVTTSSIIAVDGEIGKQRKFGVSRGLVFKRDLNICAYCGHEFFEKDLSIDHVVPQSQLKGQQVVDSWTNLVTSCKACNHRKANKTPEEAKMPLLYVPYEPNINEAFILSNRRILADQMEFLVNSGLSKHSRILTRA